MLAATVDVGDVFPRAQRLNGHKLGGFPMVWFHLGNRRRIDGARGPVSPDRSQAPTGIASPTPPSTTAIERNAKDATANGLRRYSWATVTTNRRPRSRTRQLSCLRPWRRLSRCSSPAGSNRERQARTSDGRSHHAEYTTRAPIQTQRSVVAMAASGPRRRRIPGIRHGRDASGYSLFGGFSPIPLPDGRS